MCFSIISFYLITQIMLCYFFSTSLTMVYSILFWFSFRFIWLFVCFEQSLRGKGQKVVLGLYVIVQWPSHVRLFGSPWIAACHVSLSFTTSQSLLTFMSIELVMLSNHLILCHPLLLFLWSLPAWGSFPVSQLFTSGGQSIGASAWGYMKKGKRTNFPLLSPVNCTCFHFHLLNLYSYDTVHLKNIQSPKAPGVTQWALIDYTVKVI